MYTAGSGGGGAQLERRLAESEARNQAGAAAYDKLRAELDRTVEQLRVAEHLQQRADGEVRAPGRPHATRRSKAPAP